MTEERLENIAKIVQATVPGCTRALSDKIVDWDYTYWCEGTDSVKDSIARSIHTAWLSVATDEAIAAWVASVAHNLNDCA